MSMTTGERVMANPARNKIDVLAFNGHTAGPWAVGFSDGTGQAYILADSAPRYKGQRSVTAALPKVVVSGGTDDWGIEHGVRNPIDAKLIAAAPDLLREVIELREALSSCVAWFDNQHAKGDFNPKAQAAIDAGRAALKGVTK